MAGKSFAKELEKARRNLYENGLKSEAGHIHAEHMHDSGHAFRDVQIKEPDPWKVTSGLPWPYHVL